MSAYSKSATQALITGELAFSKKAEALPEYNAKGVALKFENGKYSTADAVVAGSAITVDGDLSEWGELKYEVNQCLEATTPNNECKFDTKWTDKYLSIAIDVRDAHVVTKYMAENIYENDSVEIFIDGSNSKAEGYNGVNSYHIYLQYDGKILIQGGKDRSADATSLDGLLYAVKCDEGGFTAEINIPFETLGITPSPTSLIGIEVANNDNDDDTRSDRQVLTWDRYMVYNKPSTWGSLYLYDRIPAVVSTDESPALDGTLDLAKWELHNSIAFKEYEGASVSFGSVCDSKHLYLGFKVEDPLKSFDTVLKDDKGEDAPPLVQFILDGDNTAKGPKNEFDYIFNWFPTTKKTVFWCATSDHHTSYISQDEAGVTVKQIKLDDGYFLLFAMPWERLTALKDGFVQRDNYSQIGFDVFAGHRSSMNFWSKAEWWGIWGNDAVADLGRIFINNPNIKAHVNSAPTGSAFYTYSIVQGSSISGKILVEDPDGDVITYSLEEELPECEGKVTVDPATGDWTYTTPNKDFVKPDFIKRDALNSNNSLDPIGVNFIIKSEDGKGGEFKTRIEIRVGYTPTFKTYYVNGDTGCDDNDGLSEETAMKTIMAAHDKLRPGDTMIIHESREPYGWNKDTYVHNGPFIITNSGLPDAYITIKAAEGEHPVLMSNGEWNIMILQSYYIIIDGLTFEGLADDYGYDYSWNLYDEKLKGINKSVGREVSVTQTNAFPIEPISAHTIGSNKESGGIYSPAVIVPHHIIVRNCTANKVPGGGIGTRFTDYVTIENCTALNIGWWSIYATSGFGTLGNIDIDDNTTDYKIIFRNNLTAGNRHFIPWLHIKRLSDGNGIIIDTTVGCFKGLPYTGKILVANNLSYENGGSGAHAFRSDYTDIINNTFVYNSATPALGYADMFANTANHINMFNNIVYSRSRTKESPASSRDIDIAYDNNIFYNYNNDSNVGTEYRGTTVGKHNMYKVDPQFTELKPVVHDYENAVYPEDWSEEKKDNARKSGFVLGDCYDITKAGVYNVMPRDTSPAWNAGNKEWSDIVGNKDNRIGVFGKIGAHGALDFEKK